jgi:hypothetical protein
MSETKTIDTKEEMKHGGIFSISQYDLETMSSEFTEINNILALAKADDGVKKLLLIEVIREFGDDIIDLLDRLPIITDKKLDTLLQGIIEVANDNIEIDGSHNDDTMAYVNLPEKRKEQEKEWIKRVLIG